MTSRDRRAALLGGGTILLAVMLLKVLPWATRSWRFASERLKQNQVLLAETRLALTTLPRMEDSMRSLTKGIAAIAPRLLSGGTRENAISDLTARISSLAGWHHAAMVTLTTLPDSVAAGSLGRVRATVVLQSDFRGAAGVMQSLARDSVATVVERVKITALEPLAPSATPEKLQIELQVSAWYLSRVMGS